MNILLIGSGGREHALAWAIAASPLTDRLVIAPGNDAMATLGVCVDVDIEPCRLLHVDRTDTTTKLEECAEGRRR